MTRAPNRRRPSFTLVELLVVIAIIAILAAITAAGVAKFLGVQPVANTRTVLRSLDTAFQKKWTEVTDLARRDTTATAVAAIQALSTETGNDTISRVIYVKLCQKRAFPQTFHEAVNPTNYGPAKAPIVSLPPLPGYVNALKLVGVTSANATTASNSSAQPGESSACLLMALQRNVSGTGEQSAETFGVGTFVKSKPIAPATKEVPCLVDGWGNPLEFCRWPLGNSQATVTPTDPTDPLMMLDSSAAWYVDLKMAQKTQFRNALHVPTTLKGATANTQVKLTPLIVSRGADGKLGLEGFSGSTAAAPGSAASWQEDATGEANDNIYCNNLP